MLILLIRDETSGRPLRAPAQERFEGRVAACPGVVPEGDVTLYVDAKKYTGTLVNGQVAFPLSKQSRGVHVVIAQYGGSNTVEASTGLSGFLVLR